MNMPRNLDSSRGFFSVDELLNLQDGAVVLDLSGAIDSFHVQTHNSPNRDLIKDKVRKGELIPLNGDALADFSTNHALLHFRLNETPLSKYVIPTYFKFQGHLLNVGNQNLEVLENIGVHKLSGEEFSHGGKGVSMEMLNESNLRSIQDIVEFYQHFVVPPIDRNGDRYVVDTRVVMVGGKAIAGICRKAEKPLTKEILDGKVLPGAAHFPTAEHPGSIEYPGMELWDKVSKAAEEIARLLGSMLDRYKNRVHSPISPFGYGTLDFILDSNGNPLIVDFDLMPVIREQIIGPVANALASHLLQLATSNRKMRDIVVVGPRTDELLQNVIAHLESSDYPQPKISRKPLNLGHDWSKS